jgi:GNAT superfamily N-acetyltransferase
MTTTESPRIERSQPQPIGRARWRRAPEILRTEGLRSVWARIVGRLVYRRLVVMSTDLSAPVSKVECELDLTISELTPDDVDAYVAFLPYGDARTARRRLAAGSRCFAAWHRGRIVCAGWSDLDLANFDAIGAVVPIGPKVVYGRGAYTVPELRRRNIATLCTATAMQQLRDEGYERGVGYVLPQNRRGFGPPAKAGVARIGSIGWFGVGPARIYFFKRNGERTRFLPRFLRGRKPAELDLDLA